MAALSPAISSNLLLILLLASAASAIEFRVGGPRGWTEPSDQSETYNQWAGRNRFHIGDTLNFKYENDSVLVVDRPGYSRCNTTSPLLSFNDGNTTVRFDRYGFYYFISGDTSHCNSGQKLIIRVMVHPESVAASPGPAVAPSPGKWSPGSGSGSGSGNSGQSGSSTSNGSSKASKSMVIAGLTGLFVVLMFI